MRRSICLALSQLRFEQRLLPLQTARSFEDWHSAVREPRAYAPLLNRQRVFLDSVDPEIGNQKSALRLITLRSRNQAVRAEALMKAGALAYHPAL
jgi:hypothetical protein